MRTSAQIVADAQSELAAGGELVLSALMRSLTALGRVRTGTPEALDELEAALVGAIEACAFTDLVSQRFGQLQPFLTAAGDVPGPEADVLLQGPEPLGSALSQNAVDDLFR